MKNTARVLENGDGRAGCGAPLDRPGCAILPGPRDPEDIRTRA